MKSLIPIELLAPAKNLECGLAAIDSGADAVYIGGPSFGARVNAGNSIEDIQSLTEYAHIFGAKIHVTINTILDDQEIQTAQVLIKRLYEIGVDAIIVQDLGLLELDLPPIELHASTQQNNSTPSKAEFLDQVGFKQIVLARELSINDVKEIKKSVKNARLEFFVHGALCAGISGRCYLSQCVTERSANRGECAQLCRVPQSLRTTRGEYLAKDKYLLSLRDLNHTENLEELMDAGIQSFKIEGRLKDEGYVRNVTAWYRRQIDAIIEKRSDTYCRSSYGNTYLTYEPDVTKSFNRGFTEYNLHEIKDNYANFRSPKFVGTQIAKITRVNGKFITVEVCKGEIIHNGDKCNYFSENGEMNGFRISRFEKNQIEIFKPIRELKVGMMLYRNKDADFERKILEQGSSKRKLKISFTYLETEKSVVLKCCDQTGDSAEVEFELTSNDKAQNIEKLESSIKSKLEKIGETVFEIDRIDTNFTHWWFVPISKFNEMRHQVLDEIIKIKINRRPAPSTKPDLSVMLPEDEQSLGFQANIYNSLARKYYEEHGAVNICDAYEKKRKQNAPVMYSKHCLRYCFGMCEKRNLQRKPEKLELIIGKNVFRLDFDCNKCMMILRDNGLDK